MIREKWNQTLNVGWNDIENKVRWQWKRANFFARQSNSLGHSGARDSINAIVSVYQGRNVTASRKSS